MRPALAHSRYVAALSCYRIAEADCAHWDYDGDGDGGHTCCDDLAKAREELRLARAAYRKAFPDWQKARA